MSEERLLAEQTIYLLYVKAYSDKNENDTVTKGSVKSHLPKEWKEKAEEIHAHLEKLGMIERKTKRGRFLLKADGYKALLKNLSTTDYKFETIAGAKVLNALLDCLKKSTVEMTKDEFLIKINDMYNETIRSSRTGTMAADGKKICQKIADRYSVPIETVTQHYEALKKEEKIFAKEDTGVEQILWIKIK